MKSKIQNLIKKQAETSRQISILGSVLFAMGIMTVATIQISDAATDADTNMGQTVSAGSLSIASVDTDVDFSAGEPGAATSANIDAVGNAITISDLRGSQAGWVVSGLFSTNFLNIDESVQMAINNDQSEGTLSWYPQSMTIDNITGASGEVTAGSDGSFNKNGESLTLISSVASGDYGSGVYNVYDIKFNYLIPTGAEAIVYHTNLRLTIV